MQILNRTRNTVVAKHARIARTFLEKARGLLAETEPQAMFFRTRFGIHTVGMRFSIDCVVCDARGRVRVFRKCMPPNRFFFWPPLWNIVVELPPSALAESGTEIGDTLEFHEAV